MKRKNIIKKALLCIDLQNDFTNKESGPLYVKGSSEDVNTICEFLEKNPKFFREIIFTMDSHPYNHISFADNWGVYNKEELDNGKLPKMATPFTTISVEDVKNGTYRYVLDSISNEEINEYMDNVNTLTLWPKHCIENFNGWDINPCIKKILSDKRILHSYFFKGQSHKTEFYSAIRPAYEFYMDFKAKLNVALMSKLTKYDEIYVCGEAMDYCVYETVKDIIATEPILAERIIILEDCMSAIDETKSANDIFGHLGVKISNLSDF